MPNGRHIGLSVRSAVHQAPQLQVYLNGHKQAKRRIILYAALDNAFYLQDPAKL